MTLGLGPVVKSSNCPLYVVRLLICLAIGLVAINKRLGSLQPDLAADSEPQKMITLTNQLFQAMSDLQIKDSLKLYQYFNTKPWKKLVEVQDTLSA